MGFSIATFNVRDLFDDEPAGGLLAASPERRRAAKVYRPKLATLSLMLRRLDADVVAFQEVGGAKVLDDLSALMPPKHPPYHRAVATQTDHRGIACGLLSRFPIRSVREHMSDDLPFPSFAEGDPAPFPGRLYTHRPVLEAQVELPDSTLLTVFVVHLKSNLPIAPLGADGKPRPIHNHRAHAEGIARSLVTRAAEALFVRSLVDARFDETPTGQVCVAGDFNDTESSVAMRAIAGDIVLAGAGLPAVDPEDPFAGRALYPCARAVPPESRFSALYRKSVAQIDHVIVSRALWARFQGAKFLNETLRDDLEHSGPDGLGSLASDHAPLRADFV